jgi:lysophospholipase L1-like esterase
MTRHRLRVGSALLVVAVALGVAACAPRVPTTTTVTASPTAIVQGSAVTVTARVKSATPATAPAGAVTFTVGTRNLGTVSAPAGVASVRVSSLAAGTRRIVAEFKGSAGWANSTSTVTVVVSPVRHHLALGDSLAAGVGAPTGKGYVPLITAAESLRVPGLRLSNLSCSGATTASMLTGGGCSYAEGTQTAAAEAFLRAHPGAVSFITIDIGANDVSGCVGSPDPTCAATRIATVQTNLTEILARLRAAAPGVPIVGMTYYNPFLAYWVAGDPDAATSSNEAAATFNTALSTTYTAGGARVAPVAAAFRTADTALTGTYNGTVVPQNVANVCTYTWMCSNADIHANAAGHQLMARTFGTTIDAAVPVG